MRAALVVLLVLAACTTAAFAAPATAQAPTQAPSTTTLRIAPFAEAFEAGEPQVTHALVEYSYTFLGQLALSDTRVHVNVKEAPAWAVVVVSPATFSVPIHASAFPGTTQYAPAQAVTVTVSAMEGTPPGAQAVVRLVASAEPNSPIAPSWGEDATLVTVAAKEHACHETVVEVALEERGSEVTTASVGGTVAAAPALASALGLAGALAGGAYAFRRRLF